MIMLAGDQPGTTGMERCGSRADVRLRRQPVVESPARGTMGRRVVARTTGQFDAPCAICGVRPTALLVEWQTDAYLAGPASPERDVAFLACFEWRYYCPDHAAVV